MSMRRVEENVVNQGWINLQEAGITIDRNTLAARLIRELRAATVLFEHEGWRRICPAGGRWITLSTALLNSLLVIKKYLAYLVE